MTLPTVLALVALFLIVALFKWCLNQFQFIQAILSGMRQNSENQWDAIHTLEQRRCPITGVPHYLNQKESVKHSTDRRHAMACGSKNTSGKKPPKK